MIFVVDSRMKKRLPRSHDYIVFSRIFVIVIAMPGEVVGNYWHR